jgi:hypothetical protein
MQTTGYNDLVFTQGDGADPVIGLSSPSVFTVFGPMRQATMPPPTKYILFGSEVNH